MKTVLVCDDVATARELLGKVVKAKGHRVEFAENGAQAIEMASKFKPDLILMDVVMPEADGFKTCREIKKNPDTENIPVVLVTSKANAADKFWGEKQGADAHIGKPFEESQIHEVLEKFAS